MKRFPGFRAWLKALAEPEASPAVEKLLAEHRQHLPVLWLMGKTGAGKSSLIQRLTGNSRAQIGNGFEPCTQTAMHYEHPQNAPVLRFLDTRGLGEAGYDAHTDLASAQQGSHAMLVLTRVDEPSQHSVIEALKSLQDSKDSLAVLHVHTALHALEGEDLQRAIQHNTQQVQEALQRDIKSVEIDFTDAEDGFDDPDVGLQELIEAIISMVPELAVILARRYSQSNEDEAFHSVRREVLGYASASATADILPAVGLIAVPGLQGKMLHALAGRYSLKWDKRMAGEFIAALGTSFLYRYIMSLTGRQLAKFIPVYGQSLGAATAASISFASTYALGRVACLYFYRRNHQEPVDSDLLREAFKKAFKENLD